MCCSFSFLKWLTRDRFYMTWGGSQWKESLLIQGSDFKTQLPEKAGGTLSWIFCCKKCSRVHCRWNTLLQSQLNHFIRINWKKCIFNSITYSCNWALYSKAVPLYFPLYLNGRNGREINENSTLRHRKAIYMQEYKYSLKAKPE